MFKILKAVAKGHMMRAVDYAAREGVPRDFSIPLITEVTRVSQVVKIIGKEAPEIRLMDAYEQYGIALKVLYEKHLSEQQDAAKTQNTDDWVFRLWKWADKNKDVLDLPRERNQLVDLKELDFSLTFLLELPVEIFNLTLLKELNLGSNGLSDLPKEICNLKQLIKLDISNNFITELPKEIGNLTQLEVLYLDGNLTKLKELEKLPEEICNLRKLKELRLPEKVTLSDCQKEWVKGLNCSFC